MAEYGIEIRDADGSVMLDNHMLTLRLWHWGVYEKTDGTVTTVYFDEPLDHEPVIVVQGINGLGTYAQLIKSGEKYVGFEVRHTANDRRVVWATESLALVFAKE